MEFQWNKLQKQFYHEIMCPYPGCHHPQKQGGQQKRALAFCGKCNKPLEWMTIKLKNGTSTPWVRRAEGKYCTYSGRRLLEESLLEWNEHGGSSGRSSCMDDRLGLVFGPPSTKYRFRFRYQTTIQNILNDDLDNIISLNIVNGILLASTKFGQIVAFHDILDAPKQFKDTVEWTAGRSHEVVEYSPTFRGPYSLITMSSKAVFRALPFLTTDKTQDTSPTVVNAIEDCEILGPPLGIDIDEEHGPLFVLWHGKIDGSFVESSFIVFYDKLGNELRRVEVEDAARPPVYSLTRKAVITLDIYGDLRSIPIKGILENAAKVLVEENTTSESPISLSPSKHASMVLARNNVGEEELWVADLNGKRLCIGSLPLSFRTQRRWRYNETYREVDTIYALAVGQGSEHINKVGYDAQVVVSTNSGVQLLQKTPQQSLPDIKHSTYPDALQGSKDPAVICGAGMVIRFAGRLELMSKELGWNRDAEMKENIGKAWQGGLTMLGRRIFVGDEREIRVFDLERVEVQ